MTRLAKGGCLTTSPNSEMLPDKRTSVYPLTLAMCLFVQVCKITDTRRRIPAGVSSMEIQVFGAISRGLRIIRLCLLIMKKVQTQSPYRSPWTAGAKEEH